MGGIAGIIRFDGQAVDDRDVEQIQRCLKHRGEVREQRIDQGILLAFGGRVERVGITCAVVDADVFAGEAEPLPFSTSYIRRGIEGFNDLNADFAVALWDVRQQTLICARDAMGVKPLYYVHQPGRFVAFASEIKALLVLREVAVRPNSGKFGEYLTWATTYVPYSADTFYEGIYSVMPGHCVQITDRQTRTLPFWKPNLSQFSTLRRADAYAAVFAERFTSAIDARLVGKRQVGAHLSGGLDSSSVSCVAQQQLRQQQRPSLHTFTIDTGLASTDESAYVRAVVEQCHPVHHTVQPVADVLDSVLTINRIFDRPEHFIIPSSFHLSVSLKASEIGCNSILTGHDGDSVIPHGFDYVDQLLEAGDWEGLRTACEQVVSYPDRNLTSLSPDWPSLSQQAKLEKYLLHVIGAEVVKQFRSRPLGRAIRILQAQQRVFNLPITAIVAYCTQRIRAKIAHRTLLDHALQPDFRQRVKPTNQTSTRQLVDMITAEHQVPLVQILNTTNVICNEQLNHIGAHYGHSYTFPFFDKHVIELGLATPLAIHFDQGRGRGLLRHGLKGVLPPAIESRLSKTNFVEYGNVSARQLYQAAHAQFTKPDHAIWGIIDRAAFDRIVATVFNPRIPMQKKTRYNWLLSRIIYLALWLGSVAKP